MADGNTLTRIIAGCKAGKPESFARLIDMYAKRCYGYFYRLTGNRAASDDLLSELFVKLATKIGSFKSGCFESWLFKIASNVFHDYLRSRWRDRKLLEARKRQLQAQSTRTLQSDRQQIDRLQVQLEKLDPDTRELIVLRFYSQLSFKELAQLRDEPIGTTLSKVHRGLKKLRQLMEQ